MRHLFTASAVAALIAGSASAGGLDRSGQGVGIIFEDGNVAEFSFGNISPDVTGTTVGTGLGSLNSGNMAGSYSQIGAGIKYQMRDNLSLSLIFDQPFGASVDYSDADAGYYTGASKADVSSSAITAVARYNVNPNFSVHGGVRYQTVEASVEKPPVQNYAINSESSSAVGYVLGAAYEIPDIALRVAVTYNSSIEHDITATETCAVVAACGVSGVTTTTSVKTPESFNIDFQTGVAADTLVFGSIRHAKWTQFDYAPTVHSGPLGQGSLQSYDEDTTAYSLGIGRRFSDQWSGALTLGYEKAQGGFAGDLAPTDGNKSIGLGATYTMESIKITGGVRYIMLGDADTEHPLIPGSTGSEFRDNSAVAIGVKISYAF